MTKDMSRFSGQVLVVVIALSVVWVSPQSKTSAVPRDLPGAFQRVVPRGAIASVDAPEFVTADEAEIADDAWILGVVIDGQARAYSLNLLNRHEVVNDRINGKAFAAVW